MNAKEDYIRSQNEVQRPSINFTQRDNVRDFARSGPGQNYNRMMDIQRQLPNMDRNDPMVQEFKDKRRSFNRYGKNPMGEMLGYTPQQMQDQYMDLSRDVRQTNKPVYNKMYPLTGGFMDYTEGGGLPGLLIKGARDISGGIQKGLKKNIGDPLRSIGSDIMSNVGIGGGLNTDEEELRNYANLTYPQDVHPGLSSIEGPMDQSEVIYSPNAPTFYDRAEGLDFDTDPNQPYVAPDDYVEDDFGAFYDDADTLASERPMPFDDLNREQAIANQYATNFVGPKDDPSRRPDMMDVAGIRSINRGNIPYPGYDGGPIYEEQFGRGEIPYGFDYDQSNKDRVDNYRLDQLLQQLLQEEETPPPFSIGATR